MSRPFLLPAGGPASSSCSWSSSSSAAGLRARSPVKFQDAQKNETVSFLPGDKESVKALVAVKKYPGDELAPAVTIYHRPGGIHYKEWYGLLLAAGHKVGGRDPVATFLAQVHRCDNVEHIGRRTGRFRLVAYPEALRTEARLDTIAQDLGNRPLRWNAAHWRRADRAALRSPPSSTSSCSASFTELDQHLAQHSPPI